MTNGSPSNPHRSFELPKTEGGLSAHDKVSRALQEKVTGLAKTGQ